jgi:hypothetical protein
MSLSPVQEKIMRWITPFAWVDTDDALHLDVPRALADVGLPDTEENREICVQAMLEMLYSIDPKQVVVVQ